MEGLPSYQRFPLEQALSTMPDLWVPTYLPEAYSFSMGIVVAAPSSSEIGAAGAPLGDDTYEGFPPQLTFVGRDGSLLTILVSPLRPQGLNIPVAPRSIRSVHVGDSLGAIIYGHWLVQVSEDGTSVRRGWDRIGAKRLLLSKEDLLFDFDVMPGDAISDQELIRIAQGLKPAGVQ